MKEKDKKMKKYYERKKVIGLKPWRHETNNSWRFQYATVTFWKDKSKIYYLHIRNFQTTKTLKSIFFHLSKRKIIHRLNFQWHHFDPLSPKNQNKKIIIFLYNFWLLKPIPIFFHGTLLSLIEGSDCLFFILNLSF